MATANINIRIDSELKKEAETLFDDLGLNMTSAITVFLKTAVMREAIPFEIKRVTPNPETATALAEYEEMQNNPEKYKRYASVREMMDEVLEDA